MILLASSRAWLVLLACIALSLAACSDSVGAADPVDESGAGGEGWPLYDELPVDERDDRGRDDRGQGRGLQRDDAGAREDGAGDLVDAGGASGEAVDAGSASGEPVDSGGGAIDVGEPLPSGCIDADGDGVAGYEPVSCVSGDDCDDSNANVRPGAVEICDGFDNDCDGLVDMTRQFTRDDGTRACPWGGDDVDRCGPADCNFHNVCVCPVGPELEGDPPDTCYCAAI